MGREYAMILGDGPSPTGGPTLEIDWMPQLCNTIGLEEYEGARFPRRTKGELHIPGEMRTTYLLESGYSLRQITEAKSKAEKRKSLKTKSFDLSSRCSRMNLFK